MINIEKIDNELYKAMYGLPKAGNMNDIWGKIKSNPQILREAVKIRRNKWNNGDITNGIAISNAMLTDYEDIDSVAYNELIDSIYTNTDIARMAVSNTFDKGCSFLTMSLCNHNLKLTQEQKAFAISEAMSNDTQAHRNSGFFGIEYYILKNPNWTLEEKQKLIMDFWENDEDYDEYLEQWEWEVVNDNENYKGNSLPPFDRYDLFNDWTYEKLLRYHQNQEITDRIWEEIEFCRQMHELRPQQWEIKTSPQKVLTQPIQQKNLNSLQVMIKN